MPFLTIEMKEGRTIEQKRELVAKVTNAVCESVQVNPESVRIVIRDIRLENHAIGGKLSYDAEHD